MAEEPNTNAAAELRPVVANESVGNRSRIEMREIFRALILDEIRRGGLTKTRRRRIIQYAAHLNLSATEVGRMITTCRDELLTGDDPDAKSLAVRMVQQEAPPAACTSPWATLGMFALRGLTVGFWLIVGLMLLAWLTRR